MSSKLELLRAGRMRRLKRIYRDSCRQHAIDTQRIMEATRGDAAEFAKFYDVARQHRDEADKWSHLYVVLWHTRIENGVAVVDAHTPESFYEAITDLVIR